MARLAKNTAGPRVSGGGTKGIRSRTRDRDGDPCTVIRVSWQKERVDSFEQGRSLRFRSWPFQNGKNTATPRQFS